MNMFITKGIQLPLPSIDAKEMLYEKENIKKNEITKRMKMEGELMTPYIQTDILITELINKTGGVIQGMSGSPIIQDNKIIGAVTHVIVDNPVTGYGILITNMLEEGEK